MTATLLEMRPNVWPQDAMVGYAVHDLRCAVTRVEQYTRTLTPLMVDDLPSLRAAYAELGEAVKQLEAFVDGMA